MPTDESDAPTDTAAPLTRSSPETARRNWTTIVLEECVDGRWRATQTGVDVEGYGETAAAAAREYCERIEAGTHA